MADIFDVAVIGGGPAGYVGAIRAAQLGGKVVLFERDTVGGTCLNRGCIPTKTFVKTGESIAVFKKAPERGVVFSAPVTAGVDMGKVVAYKNGVVKKLTGGVAGLLRSNGVTVVKGEAKLAGEKTIECEGKTYETKNILLCGGSKPALPPIPGIDGKNVITSNELLDIDHVPEKLCIIGGGIIGCEFALPFTHFGSKVTLIEATDRIMPMMDTDVSDGIRKGMESIGVSILTSTRVERIEERGGKTVVIAAGREFEADKVVIAIGRAPVPECLGALKDKIKMENGRVAVDSACRTSIPGVYACGDLSDKANLASAAFKMGECAAACAMGRESAVDLSKVPNCVHAEPEAASVGLTEAEARAKYGDDLLVGKFPFGGNGMCLAAGLTEGFVKVLAEKKYGEIVGVHILGGDATELIAEVCDLLTEEITVNEAADILHPHPSMAEAFMEACADALGRCIHLPKKK